MVAWTFGGTIQLRTICIFVVSHVYTYKYIYILRPFESFHVPGVKIAYRIALIYALPCNRYQTIILIVSMLQGKNI